MSAPGFEHVQTARMRFEPLDAGHADELAALLCDPLVARTTWIGTEPPTTDQVVQQLGAHLLHWQFHGFGLWLLRDLESGAMVGRGGLQHTEVEGTDEVEIAWAIVPERWNQGLATELALKSVELGFDTLDLERLVVLTLPHNSASRRVAEKVGFAHEGETEHAGVPHALYRRRRGNSSDPTATLPRVGSFNPVQ